MRSRPPDEPQMQKRLSERRRSHLGLPEAPGAHPIQSMVPGSFRDSPRPGWGSLKLGVLPRADPRCRGVPWPPSFAPCPSHGGVAGTTLPSLASSCGSTASSPPPRAGCRAVLAPPSAPSPLRCVPRVCCAGVTSCPRSWVRGDKMSSVRSDRACPSPDPSLPAPRGCSGFVAGSGWGRGCGRGQPQGTVRCPQRDPCLARALWPPDEPGGPGVPNWGCACESVWGQAGGQDGAQLRSRRVWLWGCILGGGLGVPGRPVHAVPDMELLLCPDSCTGNSGDLGQPPLRLGVPPPAFAKGRVCRELQGTSVGCQVLGSPVGLLWGQGSPGVWAVQPMGLGQARLYPPWKILFPVLFPLCPATHP